MASLDLHEAQGQPKLLPVVRRVIQQLNILYSSCAHVSDDVAQGRLAEAYRQWLASGKTGPSGLRIYAQTLADALLDAGPRAAFAEQAEEVLVHLQSGYAR